MGIKEEKNYGIVSLVCVKNSSKMAVDRTLIVEKKERRKGGKLSMYNYTQNRTLGSHSNV